MAFGLGFHIISAPSFASQGGLPPPPPAEKATYLDFIRSRHTLQNALALSSYGPTSNAQHDQRYKSDADKQHYERDGVVFEPMPITGKHDVSSPFQMDCENRLAVAPRSSGGLLPPSPPDEKATTSKDQAGQPK